MSVQLSSQGQDEGLDLRGQGQGHRIRGQGHFEAKAKVIGSEAEAISRARRGLEHYIT